MEYALIGEHLPHSFSKTIHTQLGRYSYDLHEVAKDDLDSFLTERNFKGLNVTIPYKQDVIPYLYEISDRAKKIGAVNTIVNRDGRLYGDNTDFGGMCALINHIGLSLEKKKVLILGTGGTSKTALAVANSLNAQNVYRVSRTAREGAITYEEAYQKHNDAQIIINTTPSGMYPHIDDSPIDIEKFPMLEGVIDAVYNPLRTKLVSSALKRGLKASGGLYMLVAQAVLAGEIFTNEKFPDNTIDSVYSQLAQSKENIVLVGMPSSGKSTIGALLKEKLGRDFFDTDAVIVKNAGKPIPEIFSESGEKYFRDLETEAVHETSMNSGIIIATGGGAVLRQENVDLLKMNGRIIFLDSPIEQLCVTGDRPLSNTSNKLIDMYEVRYPIYVKAADIRVDVDKDASITLQRVLNALATSKI